MDSKFRELSDVALAAFAQASVEGTLGKLTTDGAFRLARSVSADPSALSEVVGAPGATKDDAETLVLDEYFAERSADLVRSVSSERDTMVRRMRSERRNRMFESAGITPDEAARVSFDDENGDPSSMNLVKERFYFE